MSKINEKKVDHVLKYFLATRHLSFKKRMFCVFELAIFEYLIQSQDLYLNNLWFLKIKQSFKVLDYINKIWRYPRHFPVGRVQRLFLE